MWSQSGTRTNGAAIEATTKAIAEGTICCVEPVTKTRLNNMAENLRAMLPMGKNIVDCTVEFKISVIACGGHSD